MRMCGDQSKWGDLVYGFRTLPIHLTDARKSNMGCESLNDMKGGLRKYWTQGRYVEKFKTLYEDNSK